MKFDERILSEKNTVSGRILETLTRNYSSTPTAGQTSANGNNTGLFGSAPASSTEAGGSELHAHVRPDIHQRGAASDSPAAIEHDTPPYQGTDYNAKFGITRTSPPIPASGRPASHPVSGYQQIGPRVNFPVSFSVNSFQYGDTLTWVKGAHLVKFGGDIVHYPVQPTLLELRPWAFQRSPTIGRGNPGPTSCWAI